jgi:hypothetical protein
MTSNLLNDGISVLRGSHKLTAMDAIRALRHLIEAARTKLRVLEDEEHAKHRRSVPVRAHERSETRAQAVAKSRKVREVAAKAALSIYKTIMLAGKAIGDIWYDELLAIRTESRFAATLADKIMKCGIPAKPTQIKNMVSEAQLAQMVERAKRAAAA